MIGQAFLSSIGGLLIDSVNINNILLRFHELACRTAVIFLRFQAFALGLPPFACKRKEKKKKTPPVLQATLSQNIFLFTVGLFSDRSQKAMRW